MWLGFFSAWSRPLPGWSSVLLHRPESVLSCSAWQCSAWARPSSSLSVAPVFTVGLDMRLWVIGPIGSTEYLATGHFVVWHCLEWLVLLLGLLSWLHWCPAWLCFSAWSSRVGAKVWLGFCSAWSRPLPWWSSELGMQSVLGWGSAWQSSAWSNPARSCAVGAVGVGGFASRVLGLGGFRVGWVSAGVGL